MNEKNTYKVHLQYNEKERKVKNIFDLLQLFDPFQNFIDPRHPRQTFMNTRHPHQNIMDPRHQSHRR